LIVENLKAYIESGVLELYALGELSLTEKQEVEEMAAKYPEIQSELTEIQQALLGYAEANALVPSDRLRNDVLASLEYSEQPVAAAPVVERQTAAEPQIRELPARSNTNFYKLAFAASLALLVVSLAALGILWNRLQDSQNQLVALQTSNQSFANRVNYMGEELKEKSKEVSVLRSPDFKFITLKPTPAAPKNASILVAFNPKKQEVMIDLTSMKMPANDQQHQYQLWALVDGKPVDLGVFDMDAANADGMVQMKAIEKADAFAVTLEPRGGSSSPTLTQMMVMSTI